MLQDKLREAVSSEPVKSMGPAYDFLKKLRYLGRPRAEVRHPGSLAASRAQR